MPVALGQASDWHLKHINVVPDWVPLLEQPLNPGMLGTNALWITWIIFDRGNRCRNEGQRPSCFSARATTIEAGMQRFCSIPLLESLDCRGKRRRGPWPLSVASRTSAQWLLRRSRPWRPRAFRQEAMTRLPVQMTIADLERAERIVALKQAEHQPLMEARLPFLDRKSRILGCGRLAGRTRLDR